MSCDLSIKKGVGCVNPKDEVVTFQNPRWYPAAHPKTNIAPESKPFPKETFRCKLLVLGRVYNIFPSQPASTWVNDFPNFPFGGIWTRSLKGTLWSLEGVRILGIDFNLALRVSPLLIAITCMYIWTVQEQKERIIYTCKLIWKRKTHTSLESCVCFRRFVLFYTPEMTIDIDLEQMPSYKAIFQPPCTRVCIEYRHSTYSQIHVYYNWRLSF